MCAFQKRNNPAAPERKFLCHNENKGIPACYRGHAQFEVIKNIFIVRRNLCAVRHPFRTESEKVSVHIRHGGQEPTQHFSCRKATRLTVRPAKYGLGQGLACTGMMFGFTTVYIS